MKIIHIILFAVLNTIYAVEIREIPKFDLPDVAMASYDQFGPVIYFNPNVTARIGPFLTEFFQAHEYGHHALGHLRREQFEANQFNRPIIRQKFEMEADRYAATRISKPALFAAIEFFELAQGPRRPDWYHPTGFERAMVLRMATRP